MELLYKELHLLHVGVSNNNTGVEGVTFSSALIIGFGAVGS